MELEEDHIQVTRRGQVESMTAKRMISGLVLKKRNGLGRAYELVAY